MDYNTLKQLTEQRMTIRQIGQATGYSYANVRYWLRKHGLETARGPHGGPKDPSQRFTCACGERDPEKFYGNYVSKCGKCNNQRVIKKGREVRVKVINALGGKCQACSFDMYPCSLDVHHVDASLKDPSWKHMRGWSWPRIEKEIIGYVLLCRNCHAAVHAGYIDIENILEKMQQNKKT